jgi:hypothetical protein
VEDTRERKVREIHGLEMLALFQNYGCDNIRYVFFHTSSKEDQNSLVGFFPFVECWELPTSHFESSKEGFCSIFSLLLTKSKVIKIELPGKKRRKSEIASLSSINEW